MPSFDDSDRRCWPCFEREREGDHRRTALHQPPAGPVLIKRLDEFDAAVVVAVIAVRMVEVPVHEIVNVVAVRYGFVPAPRSVDVSRLMAAALHVQLHPAPVARRGQSLAAGTAVQLALDDM
jgi:hypothetical protein